MLTDAPVVTERKCFIPLPFHFCHTPKHVCQTDDPPCWHCRLQAEAMRRIAKEHPEYGSAKS